MKTNNFLQHFAGCELQHIIIPGSHDAGLSRTDYGSLGIGTPAKYTVTQNSGVGDQALWGSRFFDVRIISSGGSLKAYHSPSDTRLAGGTGQSFVQILDELRNFVQSNPSEFVIIRLSHLKDSASIFKALEAWMASHNNGNFVYKGTGNIASKRVSDVAGKLILVIENKKLVAEKFGGKSAVVPGQTQGFHKLYQIKGKSPLPSVNDGLCVCGEFSNKNTLTKIVEGQRTNFTNHDQHRDHDGSHAHLYCLYWTSTGGNIAENTTATVGSNFDKVREMVASKAAPRPGANLTPLYKRVEIQVERMSIIEENHARISHAIPKCSMPNIVLYDFVNADMSSQIIGLNGLITA